MRHHPFLTPLAALLTAGCAASVEVGCSAVGCTSGVFFTLSDLGATQTGTLTIHACLDDVCVDTTAADPGAAYVVTTDTGPRSGIASIRISHGDTVLVQGSVPVQLAKVSPNGDTCGPICYSAVVDVTKDGLTLGPAPS